MYVRLTWKKMCLETVLKEHFCEDKKVSKKKIYNTVNFLDRCLVIWTDWARLTME